MKPGPVFSIVELWIDDSLLKKVFFYGGRALMLPAWTATFPWHRFGWPCRCNKCRGVDEVVVEGEYGLLFPLEDANSLAEAVLQLLRNTESRRKMGISARHRIEQVYTIDRICGKYLEIMLNK